VAAPAAPSAPAPVRTRSSRRLPHSPWAIAVWLSVLVLVAVVLALAIDWLVSSETRVTTYAVTGSPSRIVLNVRSGDVEVLGGGTSAVEVRRTEHLSYGHRSRERRAVSAGVLDIESSCPTVIVGNCSADYRLTVPDNVPIAVHTGDGSVHLAAFRGSATVQTGSGDVSADAFCGFSLAITTGSGDAHATTACSPQRLTLRSGSGSLDATVPPGRYQVNAKTGDGTRKVTGLSSSAQAPFAIEAQTGSGDVTIKGVP
jgi:DUF4097 and DUF4098 domain-containing protein YvlB